jgi:hypothetical protein
VTFLAMTDTAAGGTPTPDVDSQWLRRGPWQPALGDFRLDWQRYGNGADTLWFDDVVLGRPGSAGPDDLSGAESPIGVYLVAVVT